MNKKIATQKTFNDLSLDEVREWEGRFCDVLVATHRDGNGNLVEKYETRMFVGLSESWAYFLDMETGELWRTVFPLFGGEYRLNYDLPRVLDVERDVEEYPEEFDHWAQAAKDNARTQSDRSVIDVPKTALAMWEKASTIGVPADVSVNPETITVAFGDSVVTGTCDDMIDMAKKILDTAGVLRG